MVRDVFLISIDCLRPDYVGLCGSTRGDSPVLDRLGQGAAVFTQAVTHAPFTTPAVASILTGAYPFRTGVRLLLGQLCASHILSIADYAARADYLTAGFPSTFILNSPTGLGRGFDRYRDVLDGHDTGRGGCWQSGGQLNAALDDFLAEAGRRKVFCWVHYFDLHDYHLDTGVPADAAYSRTLREIVDGVCLGGLADVLRRHGRLDDAALIITADHGEDLFQHGQRGHGHHLYDSVLRVPLIWKWGELTEAGRRIPVQVRHVDILPTLLNLWGFPRETWPEHLDGQSLVPLLKGDRVSRQDSYAETSPRQLFEGDITAIKSFGGPEQVSLRTGEHKLILADSGAVELYDLNSDPGERRDLARQQPELRDELLERLQAMTTDREVCFGPTACQPGDEEKVRRRLAALGYVG